MKVLTIFDDVPEEKIITPKARHLVPNQKRFKKKNSSNKIEFRKIKSITKNFNEKSLNLEKISIEEINKDFLECKQNLEEEECYDEIKSILSSSTKDSSFDSKKNKKIKRPHCPIEKNVEISDDKDFFNLSKEFESISQI